MKTTIFLSRDSTNCALYRVTFLLILLAFGLTFSPHARAVDPPPVGGYPGNNTAAGDDALFSLTIGVNNTAIGFDALYFNTTGVNNTATGIEALYSNTTGIYNTAIGSGALYYNTTGDYNTANGVGALLNNTTGFNNTASGNQALLSNTAGFSNTANGISALSSNTTGNFNTANGVFALYYNTTGNSNIALGFQAGVNIMGNSNIDIGNVGVARDSGTIRVGTKQTHWATFVAGISGATVPTGVAVIVDANGHLGTITSSARFKEAIKPMDKASEAILALKPVTFRYREELDPARIPQFGLVAEQVEKVDPDLVACDDQDKPYSVRYEAVNAMLLNEFLKAHRKIEDQEATIAELRSGLRSLATTLKEQAALIQKMSAQFQATKPVPRIVLNH